MPRQLAKEDRRFVSAEVEVEGRRVRASVRANAAFPVLLVSTTCAWLAVTVALVFTGRFAATLGAPLSVIGALLLKSVIVGASWTATCLALRTLPTCAAPAYLTAKPGK